MATGEKRAVDPRNAERVRQLALQLEECQNEIGQLRSETPPGTMKEKLFDGFTCLNGAINALKGLA